MSSFWVPGCGRVLEQDRSRGVGCIWVLVHVVVGAYELAIRDTRVLARECAYRNFLRLSITQRNKTVSLPDFFLCQVCLRWVPLFLGMLCNQRTGLRPHPWAIVLSSRPGNCESLRLSLEHNRFRRAVSKLSFSVRQTIKDVILSWTNHFSNQLVAGISAVFSAISVAGTVSVFENLFSRTLSDNSLQAFPGVNVQNRITSFLYHLLLKAESIVYRLFFRITQPRGTVPNSGPHTTSPRRTTAINREEITFNLLNLHQSMPTLEDQRIEMERTPRILIALQVDSNCMTGLNHHRY